LTLFSRNKKSLNRQFPYIVDALADLPDGSIVDGELVAIDDSGRPDFNLVQNFRAEASRIHYYVFDLLRWKERDLTRLPLNRTSSAPERSSCCPGQENQDCGFTSRLRQGTCWLWSASNVLKESSENKRTATTNRESGAALGSRSVIKEEVG